MVERPPASSFPGALPVDAALPDLRAALSRAPTAILTAPPGAGKTTRVPLALLGEAWCTGKVLVLEPRRIAARAAASYVSAAVGEQPGGLVGYRVRLDQLVSDRTRIEFITEGVGTRLLLDDPELKGVSAIVFDEFHERSLDADLALALALDVQGALRPDLRILLMSATLEANRLSEFLGRAPVIDSPGSTYPVEVRYEEKPAGETAEHAVARTVQKYLRAAQGSILAFLPGQAEIRRAAGKLEDALPNDVSLHCLYGALDPGEQDAAIRPAPPGKRKIVLATSIAETSLTIVGVRVVIDCGLARVPRFEPRSGLTRLETVRASRFSIAQRAGRAGRTAPGIAVRLWREVQNAVLPDATRPEILEADLGGLALDLAAWGVDDPAKLRWLDPPPSPAWREALATLREIGALDANGGLTADGRRMGALALPPRYGAMVVRAASHGQGIDAAMLAILVSERGLGGSSADLSARLENFRHDNAPRAKAARRLALNMARTTVGGASEVRRTDDLSPGALLSFAWPGRIAQRRGNGYRLANGTGALAQQDDPFAHQEWLVVADLQGSAAAARISAAAPILKEEIERLHGATIVETRDINFDTAAGAIRARRSKRLGELVLSQGAVTATPDEIARGLLGAIRENGLASLDWGKATARLRDRMAFIHARDPAGGWPDVADEALLARLEDWLLPFLGSAGALSDISSRQIGEGLALLLTTAGKSLSRLDKAAPEYFTTPAGSRIRLRYEAGDVVLPVKVQELFGQKTHPTLAGGTLALTLELLSPALRPIQVTRDLPGFWKGSWREVRAQLRGRYPRHSWPEDPAVSLPTSRAKPRGRLTGPEP